MAKIKTILFDWEGVISPEVYGFERIIQRLDQEGADPEVAHAALRAGIGSFMRGKITDDEFWEDIEANISRKISYDIREWAWREWKGAIPDEQMIALVQQLRGEGYRTLIFSNVISPCEAIIRENGDYAHFDAEVLSCRVGFAKPDEQIYDLAIAVAQCRPEECLFIDDRQRNLDVAAKYGIQTILAKDVAQMQRDILQAATKK